MKNFRIWSGLSLIFVSGAIAGAIGSTLLIRQHVKGFVRKGPHMANRMIVYDIIREMDLSRAQRDSIDGILDADRPEMERLGAEFGKSIEEFTGKQFEKIKAVLDDSQKKIFDAKASEIRERFEKMRFEKKFERGGPGGPPIDRHGPPPEWGGRDGSPGAPRDSLDRQPPPTVE